MIDEAVPPRMTGRCYCGATRVQTAKLPSAVAYCHCMDCRRVTGAPVAAFAAFDDADVTFSPNDGRSVTVTPGATRTFCETCGSPLAGRYDYLPGLVYVAIGLLDQADEIPPTLHAHFGNKLSWLHIKDDLERQPGSARSRLCR